MPFLSIAFRNMVSYDYYISRANVRYGAHLAERTASLLPFAAVLHLAIGVWMLSNPDVIPTVRMPAAFRCKWCLLYTCTLNVFA